MNIPVLLRSKSSRISDGWGIIRDISLGGIGFETRMPIKEGQTIHVSFTLADNFSFANTKGTIRRAIREGIYYVCGIEFDLLVDREHLQDALVVLSEIEAKEKPQQ